MGQRHQAFVISRVAGKYRCIVAIHHQLAYGRRPLIATHNFLQVIENPLNARIIRAEIAALESGTPWGKPKTQDSAPCPYISQLFLTAWGLDPTDRDDIYAFQTFALDAQMGSADGDNNDGITVVDVTPGQPPTYCHVSIYGLEAAHDNRPTMTPLSGEEYCRAYYPDPGDAAWMSQPDEELSKAERGYKDWEVKTRRVIAQLKDTPVMPYATLAETWPEEYREQREQPLSEPAHTIEQDETCSAVPEEGVPPLIDLTLRRLVQQAVEEGDTHAILDMIDLQLADKAAFIVSTLRELSPFATEAGATILSRALSTTMKGTDRTLDLRGFHLSPSQLVHVVGAQEGLHALDLADIQPAVTADVLADILSANRSIKRVDLLDCPAISSADLRAALAARPAAFAHVRAILHPALLSGAPTPSPFALVVYDGQIGIGPVQPALATPTSVVRGLSTYLGWLACMSLIKVSEFGKPSIPLAAFCSPEYVSGQDWNARAVLAVPSDTVDWSAPGPVWVFAFHFNMPWDPQNAWAFLRVEKGDEGSANGAAAQASPLFPPGATVTRHDLSGFLESFSEGKEPAPAEEVAALRTIFDKIALPFSGDHPGQYGVKFMDEAGAQSFVTQINQWNGASRRLNGLG